MNKKKRLLQGPLMYLLLLAVILSVVWMLGSGSPVESVTLSYSDFLEWVQADLRADSGEKLTGKQILCFVMSTLGLVMITGLGDLGGGSNGVGILFGLGAASLYASVVILNKKIVVHDFYQKTIIQLAAAAVVLTPYVLLTEDFGKIVINPTVVALLMVVGIVHTGIAYALYFGGMAELKAQSVAILSYIDPVAALVLSAVILKERMSIWGIIGSAVIIASAMISERNNEKMQIEN